MMPVYIDQSPCIRKWVHPYVQQTLPYLLFLVVIQERIAEFLLDLIDFQQVVLKALVQVLA